MPADLWRCVNNAIASQLDDPFPQFEQFFGEGELGNVRATCA